METDHENISITKTRLFKYTENFTTKKNENFQIKNSDIFHISAQNIDCVSFFFFCFVFFLFLHEDIYTTEMCFCDIALLNYFTPEFSKWAL